MSSVGDGPPAGGSSDDGLKPPAAVPRPVVPRPTRKMEPLAPPSAPKPSASVTRSIPNEIVSDASAGVRVGDYEVLEEIAAGGMATVHLGRSLRPRAEGEQPSFIAIKRMHAQFSRDHDFRSMFLDEARLAARITHTNVVKTIDVVETNTELLLVLELILGESLSRLGKQAIARGERIPLPIVGSVVVGMLHGLNAAHEAENENGEPLQIVHRDVSPHNVIVGMDGIARVLDFGVAKARGRMQQTQQGQIKGKLAYMSPEHARGKNVDRRADIFSAGIVLWELLARRKLFDGENEASILAQILTEVPPKPSSVDIALRPYDDLVMRALALNPDERYATALEMAKAVENTLPQASLTEVGEWVLREARAGLEHRQRLLARYAAEDDEPSTFDTDLPTSNGRQSRHEEDATIARSPTLDEPRPVLVASHLPMPPPPSDPQFRPLLPIGLSGTTLMPAITGPHGEHSGMEVPRRYVETSTPTPSGRVSVPSQVTSISLTTTDMPPPLPPERVRTLFMIAGGTASGVALTLAAILVIFSKKPWSDGDAGPSVARVGVNQNMAFVGLEAAKRTTPPEPAPEIAPPPQPTVSSSAGTPPPVPSSPQPPGSWKGGSPAGKPPTVYKPGGATYSPKGPTTFLPKKK